MTTHGCSHVVGRSCFAPLVDKFAAWKREFGPHIGISKHEDRSFFIDTFRNHKLEHAIRILRDSQVSDWACRWIELSEVATTGLAMEHGHNLHRRLVSLRNVKITRPRMADDADILGKIDAVHFPQRRKLCVA